MEHLMRIGKNGLTVLAALGQNLKDMTTLLGGTDAPAEVKLEALTGHLVNLGDGLLVGDLSLLGLELTEAKMPPRKAASKKVAATVSESEEEPDFMFWIHKDDPMGPIVVDGMVEGKQVVFGCAVDEEGLNNLKAVVSASYSLEEKDWGTDGSVYFREVEGIRPGGVFLLSSYVEQNEKALGAKARRAYAPLVQSENMLLGNEDHLVECTAYRKGDAGIQGKGTSANRRIELDKGRPYSREALSEMSDADLTAVAKLAGCNPLQARNREALVDMVLAADSDHQAVLSEDAIAEGLKAMSLSDIKQLMQDEGIEEPGSESLMTEEGLRAYVADALTKRHVPNPEGEVAF